jgi:hypothetical protein
MFLDKIAHPGKRANAHQSLPTRIKLKEARPTRTSNQNGPRIFGIVVGAEKQIREDAKKTKRAGI